MKLYEPSILLKSYNSVSFDGASTPEVVFDNDKQTIATSSQSDPTFAMELDASEIGTASALWLRTRGYTNVAVSAGGTEVMNESIPSDGYLYHEFTEASDRDWMLDFTGTGGIYECYLCKLILDWDTDDKRPFWRIAQHLGVFFRARNGSLINFQPFELGNGRATITVEWDLLDNANVADLLDVFQDSTSRNFQFGVYPAPNDRPHHFFMARWDSPFNFRHAGSRVQQGQSGSVVFVERSPTLLKE